MIEDPTHETTKPVLVDFIFGPDPIIYIDSSDSPEDLLVQVEDAFDVHDSDTIVLGIRMNIIGNLIGFVTPIIPGITESTSGLGQIYRALDRGGLHVEEELACLPSIENARFFFPTRDHSSHLMLLRNFLLPRRYSLGHLDRIFLKTYIFMITIFRSPKFLYRGLFVQVRRC